MNPGRLSIMISNPRTEPRSRRIEEECYPNSGPRCKYGCNLFGILFAAKRAQMEQHYINSTKAKVLLKMAVMYDYGYI